MNLPPDFATLQLVLDGDTDILIRRDFSHPPAKIWRGLTDPALILRWLEGVIHCEMDLRPGGSFRYDFDAFSFTGPVLEVDAPHRLVHVEHFSKDPAYRVESTVTLAAHGTGTRMTNVLRYADAEARAAAIRNGFTDGLEDVYARFDALDIPG